jgi:hypothetical protein
MTGRQSTPRRIWRTTVVIGALVGAAAVIDVTIAGGSTVPRRIVPDPALRRPTSVTTAATRSAAIPPQLASEMSVFSRSQTAADLMPTGLARWMASILPQFAPATPASRSVTASDGETVYLTPGTDAICTGGTGTADSFCAPMAALPTGQAISLDLCSPSLPTDEIQMEWMLPDTATNVAVRLSNGQDVKLPASNVYIKQFPISGALPSTIVWKASGSQHSADAGIPSDVKQQQCVHPGDVLP